jgi:hypothetical protein
VRKPFAVNRHDAGFAERRRQFPRQTFKASRERLRVEQAEEAREGVVARDAALKNEKLAKNVLLGAPE